MRIPYGQTCSQYDKGIKECMYMYFIIRVKSQVTEMFFEISFIHHLDDYFYFHSPLNQVIIRLLTRLIIALNDIFDVCQQLPSAEQTN